MLEKPCLHQIHLYLSLSGIFFPLRISSPWEEEEASLISSHKQVNKRRMAWVFFVFSMWTVLIFHECNECICTLLTFFKLKTLSATDSNEIFQRVTTRASGLFWRLSCDSQPGKVNLKLISLQKWWGSVVCRHFKHTPWLIFLNQNGIRHIVSQRQEVHLFLSSWVPDCRDAVNHIVAAAAALLQTLGMPTSGSLKITCAHNKQTEAITGRWRRGEGLD